MRELTAQEISVLRQLAAEYMDLASLPKQAETRELWRKLNDGAMERPMLAIDQLPWNELNGDGFLTNQVEEPYWRGVETWLRQSIRQYRDFPADMVLNPYILLPRCIGGMDYGDYGVKIEREIARTDETSAVVSSRFENQLEDWEDLEKIKAPEVTVDTEKEAAIRQTAETVFSGIAPWKMQGQIMHLGVWDYISHWMGVENVYIELMDRPEFIHEIMERVTVETIKKIEQLNALRAFDTWTNSCHCSYTFDSTLPPEGCDRDHPTSRDVWAFGLAQLFTSVSPAVTDEFEVAYMQRIFPYFGAIYYGCCDRLDDRLDVIGKLPNIRKISCSPWSDREKFAERLEKKYIMSNKPTPAYLAGKTVNWDVVRADLRRTVTAARENGVRLEMILKDLSTVQYDPSRLSTWAKIALEEASRY